MIQTQRPTNSDTTSWLRSEELAKLNSLELRARGVVEGFLQGLHRSPFVGYSVEFSSHRRYGPGDGLLRRSRRTGASVAERGFRVAARGGFEWGLRG